MIYLIDDNQFNQREENNQITFIEEGEFDGYLESIQKLKKGTDPSDISHLEFLKKADCILLHATTEDYDSQNDGFLSGSRTNAINIKENIAAEGDNIPLVLFSNSIGSAHYEGPDFISQLNKNTFYSNLYDFLAHYKKSGEVELRILVFGKNYLAQEITLLGNDILNNILVNSGGEYLRLSDLSDVLDSVTRFVELAFPGMDIDKFFNNIEDNSLRLNDVRKRIRLIIESFEKYGRNIHPWK